MFIGPNIFPSTYLGPFSNLNKNLVPKLTKLSSYFLDGILIYVVICEDDLKNKLLENIFKGYMNQREHNGMVWLSIQAPREIQAEMTLGFNARTIQDGLRKTVLFKNMDKCLFGNPATMLVTWPTITPLPKFVVDSNGIFQRMMVSN